MSLRFPVAALLVAGLALPAVTLADPAAFAVSQRYALGGPGGWDYLTVDADAQRLFIARADRVLVVSTRDGSLLGTIPGTEGVHGVALAPDLGKGFTSNGRADAVTVFDLKTLAPTGTIAVGGHNPDAIVYDRTSGRLFTFNGRSHDISVIDPAGGKVIATIPVGGKPEFAQADGRGRIFFNIEDTAQLAELDAVNAKLAATWKLPDCEEPTGLALDLERSRLFSTCQNGVLAVTDATSGRHVASVPIGQGPDAAGYDAARHLVFSSNGDDGTLTVIRQQDADHYQVVQTVTTQPSARTLALDARTHVVYTVAAKFGPAPPAVAGQPRQRPPVLDGSFVLIAVGDATSSGPAAR